jgi:glycerol kinase
MQFQADILGIPISRPGLVETTALGAALLAGIGAGWWKRASDLETVRRSGRVFRPRMKRAERERLYRGWIEAVEMLLAGTPG